MLLESAAPSETIDVSVANVLVDAFELSRVCANALLRRSPATPWICGVCARAARRVSEMCAGMCDQDYRWAECAAQCCACAAACDAAAERFRSGSRRRQQLRRTKGQDGLNTIH